MGRAEEVVERVARVLADAIGEEPQYWRETEIPADIVSALVTELGITAGMVAYHRQLAHEYREEGAEHNAGAQTLTANALSTLLEIAEP